MKKKIYLLILPFILAVMAGCSNWLDEENHSKTTQEFLKTPEGFKMGLNSAYNVLGSMYGDEGGVHGLMNPGTDEYKSSTTANRTTSLSNYDPTNYTAGNEFLSNLWSGAYTNINTLNYMIGHVEEIPIGVNITLAQRTQYLGEAKFLRAFLYFNLVQQFGDVTLSTTYNDEPSRAATRQDMLEVYDVIIKDLEDATTECLPSPQQNSLESGRASGAAARHLLARVYLTLGWVYDKDAANYPDNSHNKYYNPTKAKEYYQKAYDVASKLVADASSLGLSLMPNFADVFDENNDAPSGKNKEELFVSRQDWDLDNVYGRRSTLNHYYVNGYEAYLGERNINDGRCYSWFNPNKYVYNAFNNRDKDTRYSATFQTVWYATKIMKNTAAGSDGFYTLSYTINGQKESFNWQLKTVGDTALYYPGYNMSAEKIRQMTQNRAAGNTYVLFTPDAYDGYKIFPTMMKFLDRTRAQYNDNSDRSYIIFRLGETYLLAAEAAFKLGDKTNAAKYINNIRERARNKTTTTAGALDISASDVTLDFILEERTRELLGEHCRWADLTRTGTLLTRVRMYDDGQAKTNIVTKDQLRPIPQSQINRVTQGEPYPQNEGW